MSRAVILPIDCILTFASQRITDHKRSPVSVDFKPIEFKKRMANGTLRKLLVAEKRSFKVSWEKVPRLDTQTVDGFMGATNLISFYKNHPQEFTLKITYGNSTTENIQVMFGSFNYSIANRSKYTDFYDIDLTMDEI